jgi:hypothetical protein
MARNGRKGNRETKKPKAEKPKQQVATPAFATIQKTFASATPRKK